MITGRHLYIFVQCTSTGSYDYKGFIGALELDTCTVPPESIYPLGRGRTSSLLHGPSLRPPRWSNSETKVKTNATEI